MIAGFVTPARGVVARRVPACRPVCVRTLGQARFVARAASAAFPGPGPAQHGLPILSATSSPDADALPFADWCLTRMREALPAQQFNTWIRPLDLAEPDSHGQVVVTVPNQFFLQWVRSRYLDQLNALARERLGEGAQVLLALADPAPAAGSEAPPAVLPAPAPTPEPPLASPPLAASPVVTQSSESVSASLPAAPARAAHATLPGYAQTNLNASATFDNLVTGRANDMARAAAQQVAVNPGTAYNPLFIYGGVGLGKTHLMQAIGNAVYQANPSLVVRYVHVEDYYNAVVRAYKQNTYDEFKRHYRSLDLLLIDDIQFFQNKTRSQEEFFHLFNALSEANKQIVITCDTYPKDIQGLQARLISRFDWGLTVQIEPPELEMRVAILRKKAEALGRPIDDDVAFLIAKNLRSNVRELEGALNNVVAYANFKHCAISLDVAREALKDLLRAHNRQLTIEHIQKTVADFYKIKVADMHSKKRVRAIVRPRQIAMYLAKELTALSLPAIGEAFGGRDHTTVMHACRQVTSLRAKDNSLNHDVHVLMQVLHG